MRFQSASLHEEEANSVSDAVDAAFVSIRALPRWKGELGGRFPALGIPTPDSGGISIGVVKDLPYSPVQGGCIYTTRMISTPFGRFVVSTSTL
jgi:hypothetical protein